MNRFRKWLVDQAKYEPSDKENLVMGIWLAIVLSLWIFVGPQ